MSLAAEALFGKGTDEATARYNEYADKMLECDDGPSAAHKSRVYYARTREFPRSRRADLKVQQTFFERNKARMTYADFRRRGLPHGNTLITVSEPGRVIEVTSDKAVVWEFYNPKRAGERNEFIATLFQMERIPKDYCAGWLR